MIKSVYRFHVYYQIRRILNRFKIPLSYNNPYSHEKFIEICKEYRVNDENEGSDENKVSDDKKDSCDLTKWRNQRCLATWQTELGKQVGLACHM